MLPLPAFNRPLPAFHSREGGKERKERISDASAPGLGPGSADRRRSPGLRRAGADGRALADRYPHSYGHAVADRYADPHSYGYAAANRYAGSRSYGHRGAAHSNAGLCGTPMGASHCIQERGFSSG